MQPRETFVQSLHLSTVRTGIVALLPITSFLLFPLAHSLCGQRSNVHGIGKTRGEDDGKGCQDMELVRRVEDTREARRCSSNGSPFGREGQG